MNKEVIDTKNLQVWVFKMMHSLTKKRSEFSVSRNLVLIKLKIVQMRSGFSVYL